MAVRATASLPEKVGAQMKVLKIAAVLVAFLVLHFAFDLLGIGPGTRYALVIVIAIALAILLTFGGRKPKDEA